MEDIEKHVEDDLVNAAVRYSWRENKIYPLFNRSAGLKIILEQLVSQAPANSKQMEFYITLYEKYQVMIKDLKDKISTQYIVDSSGLQNMIPNGTILSSSDKNLGPVLLPIDWSRINTN